MTSPEPTRRPLANGARLNVSIFVDDADSWILPWARRLGAILSRHHDTKFCQQASALDSGDICFLLGCTKILPAGILERHAFNFVVHESPLPEGRGWSPVQWQVLEGQNTIPVTLFRATEKSDAGPIYAQGQIELDGTELLAEIRNKQGLATIELICRLLENWPNAKAQDQAGTPTYYPRRTRNDDRLDVNQTLADSFDHLRIADNDRYPAWFEHRGKRYTLKIFAADQADD